MCVPAVTVNCCFHTEQVMEEEEILGHFCALNRKMSKNEKLRGKYDRFRCFFIYQNEKNYDKIGE